MINAIILIQINSLFLLPMVITAMQIKAKMPINTNLSMSNASINNRISSTPSNKILPDKPSRYKTKMNDKNTRATPVSCSASINKKGIIISKTAYILVENFVNFMSILLRYFASARLTANFANSAGWMPNSPILNHDLLPETSFPINETRISIKQLNRYMGYENVV